LPIFTGLFGYPVLLQSRFCFRQQKTGFNRTLFFAPYQ